MNKLFIFIMFIFNLNLVFFIPLFAQTEWTKYYQNPVLTKSDILLDWDYFAAADPCVIKDVDTLKMWYTGSGAILPDTTIAVRIGYAYSIDGINWIKYDDNPVLLPSPGEWDSLGIETVTVLKDMSMPENERYRMWYTGSGDPIDGLYQIGYAYSSDGIHWTKHPSNPVLTNGDVSSWENGGPEGPTVIKDGDTLKMWYAAIDTIPDNQPTDYHINIGYAWSLDGVQWVKYPDNPIINTGDYGDWEFAYIQDPCVIKKNNLYYMWYAGFSDYDVGGAQIGYAYSTDGINWVQSDNNPIFSHGSAGSWDANTASFPAVVWEDSTIYMWYTGIDIYPLPEWPAPYFWDIGYAISHQNPTNIIKEDVNIPSRFKLMPNYPNPFNSNTTIEYFLPFSTNVEITIYNISGENILILINEEQSKGYKTVSWNGKNKNGREVSSGLYVYKLKALDNIYAKKMLLLK